MVLIDSDFSNNTNTRGMRNQIGFLERNQRAGERTERFGGGRRPAGDRLFRMFS